MITSWQKKTFLLHNIGTTIWTTWIPAKTEGVYVLRKRKALASQNKIFSSFVLYSHNVYSFIFIDWETLYFHWYLYLWYCKSLNTTCVQVHVESKCLISWRYIFVFRRNPRYFTNNFISIFILSRIVHF